jgi:hypothetical protein
MALGYKKMAGTSAVFLREDYDGPSPVERDGMIWQAAELHLDELPDEFTPLDAMANVLALEGLEDYDPATHAVYAGAIHSYARFAPLIRKSSRRFSISFSTASISTSLATGVKFTLCSPKVL